MIITKNRFPEIILGMSGVSIQHKAAVAVDAVGPAKVNCMMMPSPYTSQASLDDAVECTGLLGSGILEWKLIRP